MTSPVGSSQIESILSQIRNSSVVAKPPVAKIMDVANPASTTKIDFAAALRAQLDQLNNIEKHSVSLGQRFALGDRDPLVFNADGSLDIWIQAASPDSKEAQANWLPVQKSAPFLLNARLYWPEDRALNGPWKMPVVERLN